MTMTMASASALNMSVSDRRGCAGRRVTAKANTVVKMISGRIASLDAAAIGLVGTIERRKSVKGGTSPTGAGVASAVLSAAADSAGIGASDRNKGVSAAPKIADKVIRAMIQAMERAAIAPAFAASAVCAIPVMSSATNSGTTVMRSAFSHKVPIRSAMSAAPPAKSGNAAAAKIPSAMPTARARRMRAALDILALSERTSYQPLPDMPLDGKRKYMSEQEQMARQFFGTDGIRGLTNTMPMTAAMAQKVGQAAGAHFMRGNHRHRVVVGKDTRLSGYMMESALISGFTSVGMDVVMVGPMPTPAVAMLARSMRADLGVMISASHNPFADNGIKLFGPDGYKLTDDDEAAIEALLDEEPKLAPPREIGRARKIEDARGRYIHAAKLTFPEHLRLDGVKVVVDCANGAAYQVAPAALWELGADVVAIGVSPNGFNINDGCGSTDTRLLQQKVVEESADIGIALDGDATG
jgi:hypothetical protein